MEFKDYYKTLGVARNASDEDIKKAFRGLARKYHPDVAKDKKTAEAKFKEINEAYEVLRNPENRRKYDELGANWKQGAGFQPPPGWQSHPGMGGMGGMGGGQTHEFRFAGTGFSDFFEQFFAGGGAQFSTIDESDLFGAGAGRRQAGPRQRRGANVEGDIMVTLEEAFRGSVRAISLQQYDPIKGESQVHTFQVRIPAGVQDGQTIRVAGKGDAGSGGAAAGDLFLHVRFASHPEFRSHGADLYHELNLAPWEAVLGATVEVPTMEKPVTVRIPAGSTDGRKLRVRGQGMPSGKGARGDLFVVLNIETPPQLTDEERKAWEHLAAISKFNPRNN